MHMRPIIRFHLSPYFATADHRVSASAVLEGSVKVLENAVKSLFPLLIYAHAFTIHELQQTMRPCFGQPSK